MKKNVQVISDLLEKSEMEEDDSKADLIVKNAIKLSKDFIDCEKNNYFYFYLVGYAWYLLRSDSKERINKIEVNLKRAIELNSNDSWAKLYLGHIYYDEGNYIAALQQFKNVSLDEFHELKQEWRIIRIKELILCCNIYLSDNNFYMDEISQLIALYNSSEEIDRPVPFEIKKCIDEIKDKVDTISRKKLETFKLRFEQIM